MGPFDVKIGNVVTHKGTRYGGERQRSEYSEKADAKEKKPAAPASKPPATSWYRNPGSVRGSPVRAEDIHWFRRTNGGQDVVDCGRLEGVVARLMVRKSTPCDPLYESLLTALRKSRIEGIRRFRIIATGIIPGRRKELGIFAKVVVFERVAVLGQEFVLPRSFFNDCRAAFVRNHHLAAAIV